MHWYAYQVVGPEVERVRVRGHTCDCGPTSYELRYAAGLACIRRTTRSPGGTRVRESPWMRNAEATRLWGALLAGRAR